MAFAAVRIRHDDLLLKAARVVEQTAARMSFRSLFEVAFAYGTFALVFPGVVDALQRHLPAQLHRQNSQRLLAELGVACAQLGLSSDVFRASFAAAYQPWNSPSSDSSSLPIDLFCRSLVAAAEFGVASPSWWLPAVRYLDQTLDATQADVSQPIQLIRSGSCTDATPPSLPPAADEGSNYSSPSSTANRDHAASAHGGSQRATPLTANRLANSPAVERPPLLHRTNSWSAARHPIGGPTIQTERGGLASVPLGGSSDRGHERATAAHNDGAANELAEALPSRLRVRSLANGDPPVVELHEAPSTDALIAVLAAAGRLMAGVSSTSGLESVLPLLVRIAARLTPAVGGFDAEPLAACLGALRKLPSPWIGADCLDLAVGKFVRPPVVRPASPAGALGPFLSHLAARALDLPAEQLFTEHVVEAAYSLLCVSLPFVAQPASATDTTSSVLASLRRLCRLASERCQANHSQQLATPEVESYDSSEESRTCEVNLRARHAIRDFIDCHCADISLFPVRDPERIEPQELSGLSHLRVDAVQGQKFREENHEEVEEEAEEDYYYEERSLGNMKEIAAPFDSESKSTQPSGKQKVRPPLYPATTLFTSIPPRPLQMEISLILHRLHVDVQLAFRDGGALLLAAERAYPIGYKSLNRDDYFDLGGPAVRRNIQSTQSPLVRILVPRGVETSGPAQTSEWRQKPISSTQMTDVAQGQDEGTGSQAETAKFCFPPMKFDNSDADGLGELGGRLLMLKSEVQLDICQLLEKGWFLILLPFDMWTSSGADSAAKTDSISRARQLLMHTIAGSS
eukprot:GHVT01095189.1.p1 GENE.GHVT01095189.1~~GHVT01095189.1.p1  ORF type:complete len:802 (+),score=172.56 GHVT01095189.1:370-2775(+)